MGRYIAASANRAGNLGSIRKVFGVSNLYRQHKSFLIGTIESRDAAGTDLRRGRFDDSLDVLRVVINSLDYDKVFYATADEQFSFELETKIPASKVDVVIRGIV
jgi:hypothetical protein